MRTSTLFMTAAAAMMSGVASAQGNPAEGWEYVGCVKAEVSTFPVVVDFFTTFPPEECQEACVSFGYAALKVGGCYCSPADPEPTFETVDEALCSNACTENEADGFCGGPEAYSLYAKADGTTDPDVTEEPTPDPTATEEPEEPTIATPDPTATEEPEEPTIATPDPTATVEPEEPTIATPDPSVAYPTYGNGTGTQTPSTPSPTVVEAGAARMGVMGAMVAGVVGFAAML